MLPTVDKKGHSILSPDQRLRARHVHAELGYSTINETLSVMVDEHYILRQMTALLKHVLRAVGSCVAHFSRLQALLSEGFKASVDLSEELEGIVG